MSLVNKRGDRLNEAMVQNGSSLSGGADPEHQHNPVTNPVPWANQNPYVKKMQKKHAYDGALAQGQGGDMYIQNDY